MSDDLIRKTNERGKVPTSTVLAGEPEWVEFFSFGFDATQASLLYETIRRCSTDWHREWQRQWQEYTLDATVVSEDTTIKIFNQVKQDLQSHRDALIKLRGQMEVLIGRGADAVIDLPPLLEGKARVVKSANVVPDALIERISDLERQSARMEKQIKTMIKGERTSGMVAKAMSQRLTKRVDRLEGRMMKVEEEI